MIRMLLALLLAAVCLTARADAEVECRLWSGRMVCSSEAPPYLLSDGGDELLDAGAAPGQELRFYLSPTASDWWLTLQEGHFRSEYASFSGAAGGQGAAIDLAASGGYVSLRVTDGMLAAARVRQGWGGTFVGRGEHVVITRIALVFGCDATPATAPLLINELMQSNVDAAMDDHNEFPDSWVELYNPNDCDVSLLAYSLGVSADPAGAWQLPAAVVPARGHRLIYCDKCGRGLHTDFRLESGKGGAVYLFRQGEVADSLTDLRRQPAPNVAYGRRTDGDAAWGYQAVPSPGAANCGALCRTVLPSPAFSEPGRVVTDGAAFTLRVTLPAEAPAQARLCYTTDGSEPVDTSAVFPASGLRIDSTCVLRVKPFCPGCLSPRSVTQSYLFHPRRQTLPVVSIVTDPRYLTDSLVGICVDGAYAADRRNYEYDWRRPVNLEFFEADGQPSQLNQLCETRIAGNATRVYPLRSLALYAHKRFGEKRFAYELFPDDCPDVTAYKSLLLRNAGNDFDHLYMRDAVMQRTMAWHADLDYQAYRPVMLYLNGQYRGILNLRERSNDDNVFTHYDGLEDIDMIENWNYVKAGTNEAFYAFRDLYSTSGHTWDEYAERLDLIEYINYMILQLFFVNIDFPGNNVVMWRPRTDGGRWRFLAKDTDFGMGLYDRSVAYDMIEYMYNPDYHAPAYWANNEEYTRLFRHLMEEPRFAREFLDRCAIYLGDFLRYEAIWDLWQPMLEAIRAELPYFRAAVGGSWPDYDAEVLRTQQWLRQRTEVFYQHLAAHYPTGAPCPLQVNDSLPAEALEDVTVTFNGVPLTSGRFDGRYYQGQQVTLSALSPDGQQGGFLSDGQQGAFSPDDQPSSLSSDNARSVTGWELKTFTPDGQLTVRRIDGPICEFTMPVCTRCEVNAIIGDEQSIDPVTPEAHPSHTAIYGPDGIRRHRLTAGPNILLISGEGGHVSKVCVISN